MNRRSLLRCGAPAVLGAVAGCSALATDAPNVNPSTGLDQDTSAALDDRPVARLGDVAALPAPPAETDALSDARVALATADADVARLADAMRDGTTVAFAGPECQAALRTVLTTVGDDFHYGVESISGRPVELVVAEPRGDAVATYQFVAEGGWDDPILDPLGWALVGRTPECDTFVPERSDADAFARLGATHVAGRLPTGETYASRTVGHEREGQLRLHTAVHAASSGGYPVAETRRVADFPNDGALAKWFPNPHEQNGVEASNHSDPVAERLDVSFSPTGDRTRGAMTGCCGVTATDALGYDYALRCRWTRDGLFGSNTRHGGAEGRGEWHVR
ncbi:MAG: hypothetical protein ABEJ68_06155 [Halobacteriaceae archaeon]